MHLCIQVLGAAICVSDVSQVDATVRSEGSATMELEELVIIDVEPVRLESTTSMSQWPCAACGTWHEIGKGFVVRHHEAGVSRTVYVCPSCAAPYVSARDN